jgi:hypothetical protein
MTRREAGSLIALSVLLAAFAPARTARADQNYFSVPAYVLSRAPLFILPSEAGVTVSSAETSFIFGWSAQLPFAGDALSHRGVADLSFVVRSSGVSSVRARLGYRYGGRHVFGGAGVGIESAGITASPELGVKFAHADHAYTDGIDTSLHLLARADVAPSTRHLSTTILLGWNLF